MDYLSTGWRRILGKNESSQYFLINTVHDYIDKNFLNIFQKGSTERQNQLNQDIKDAEIIESRLNDLKKYIQGNHTNISASEEVVLETIWQAIQQTTRWKVLFSDAQGTSQEVGIRFQKELTEISRALEGIAESLNISKKINFLQDRTGNLTISNNLKDIPSEVAKFLQTKVVQDKAKETYQVPGVGQIKTDIITSIKTEPFKSNLLIQFQNTAVLQYFKTFYDAYQHSAITAKNYLRSTISTHGLKLGEATRGRIFVSILPVVDNIFKRDDAIIAFSMALAHRIDNGSNNIQEHLDHLRIVYELTGVGQQTNTDIKELNTFLEQGARFLIINERSGKVSQSGHITVFSTLDILQNYKDYFNISSRDGKKRTSLFKGIY